ncbi:hypothetical protein NEH83_35080 [Streptomyces sp. JUS-F4]|uniref:hypothetical protein n=1 Tax=Streptomyces sp. JUS-F4 TaxID=2951988 RepID=UPI0026671E78|nr:hypothetical protein [Streptomyces sp. JUS-F4]WKN18954.1 hypothetical protein NEH83_35080 [Streptomyces sp. JUS-F4]
MVNDLATLPIEVAIRYEDRFFRSMRATFASSVEPAVLMASRSPRTARSRMLGSRSISGGAIEVKVPADRS